MRCRHLLACSLVLWIFVLLYVSYKEFVNQETQILEHNQKMDRAMNELDRVMDELDRATNELQMQRNQNKELVDLVTELQRKLLEEKLSKNVVGPSLENELARRKVDRVSLEFWLFLRSELNKLRSSVPNSDVEKAVYKLLNDSADYQKMLRNDFHTLANEVDNLADWRFKESMKLGDLVQRRIEHHQNPKDCRTAKKIVCTFGDQSCGYGCSLHHATYCLVMAYATRRTLILDSKGWKYASGGWETVFQPLSNNCREYNNVTISNWRFVNASERATVQEVRLPVIEAIHPRPDYLPLAVPQDLADRLKRFHGNPAVWWIGQFVKYLTRPHIRLESGLAERNKKLGFERPILGVHIRRTDKITSEAEFYSVDEYMQYVEEWYTTYEKRHPGVRRRVYLASDDPTVLSEAQEKYPSYTFVSDNGVSESAGLNSRFSKVSLRGIIQDIHFLSRCDFLVCTFSSQVCRAAYEMMQTMHGDASQYFKSLDDIYYFGGQNGHKIQAIEAHHMREEDNQIEMLAYDLIDIEGNHWNGYSKGTNVRTGKTGLFPSYKSVDMVKTVRMPTYRELEEL